MSKSTLGFFALSLAFLASMTQSVAVQAAGVPSGGAFGGGAIIGGGGGPAFGGGGGFPAGGGPAFGGGGGFPAGGGPAFAGAGIAHAPFFIRRHRFFNAVYAGNPFFPYGFGGGGFYYPPYDSAIEEPGFAPPAVILPPTQQGPMEVTTKNPYAVPRAVATQTVFVNGVPETLTSPIVTEYRWPRPAVASARHRRFARTYRHCAYQRQPRARRKSCSLSKNAGS